MYAQRRPADNIPEHIGSRLSACRARMREHKLDAYLVNRRNDQYYLTGFNGEDGAALILPRSVYLLTDGRFEEAAAAAAPWAKAIIRHGPLAPILDKLLRKHRVRRLGFEPAALTVQLHRVFAKAIHPAKLVASAGIVEAARLIKDGTELAAIRKAIEIAEDAFRAIIRQLRPGTTERQVAAALQHAMLDRGAESASFPIIVAEGPNSSLPHAVPGDRVIRRGSAVLIDWGAVYLGYCSDLTRVVFIHRIPPRFGSMYKQVLAAQQAAIAAIRPGVIMGDVDAAARGSLKRAGMDARFTHGLGHGVGLDIHEPPRLGSGVQAPLRTGMVVTVEPGVYYPGLGGVRIEDDILVTDDGCEVLTHLTRDLDAMVV